MTYKLLIGGYTAGGLRVLTFNPQSEEDKLVLQETTIGAGSSPSWIAQHPDDPSVVFATNEVEDGRVFLIKLAGIDGSGAVSSEKTVDTSSGGQYPAHLLILKDSVVAGNVSSRNQTVLILC